MKKTLPLIRLKLFHELGKSLAIDRDIFLDDNLDDDRTLTSYVPAGDAQQDINRFPYKLSFTAAVVMVRGQLTASVNGRQYQVSAGDALIVQSGSVVESMMCSSDLKIIAMAFTDRHDVEYMQRSTSEVSSFIQHRAFPVTVHLEEEAMSNYIRLYRAVKGIYRFQVKAVSGKSPGRIIRERVLIEAKALLNSSDLSVRQVCDTLHFPNESFFCRWFKESSGLTPTAFRSGRNL